MAESFSPTPAELAEQTFAFAREAEVRRDWAQALSRWNTAQRSFPDLPAGHLGAAVALRELGRFDEAEALIGETMARFPDDAAPRIGWAALAHGRCDWAEAAQRWDSVRAHFPQEGIGYSLGLAALRALGREAEADTVIGAAAERFPDDGLLRFEHAVVAAERADWPAAAERWALLRARFPEQPSGYVGGAVALREQGRFDEAESLLAEAVARFPDEQSALVEQGWTANYRRDWPEAVRRWETIRRRWPDEVAGYCGAAQALRQLHRFAEAEAITREAILHLPERPEPLVEHAWVAQDTRDWPEAIRRWEAARRRLPDHVESYAIAGEALAAADRFVEAEALVAEARQRFPNNPLPFAAAANIAAARSEWAEAAARWSAAQQRFPGEPEFSHRLFEARLLVAETEAAAGGPADTQPSAAPGGSELRDLILAFESLGSGCEFGDVQRRFGAEPLGLLRWAAIAPDRLAAAIEAGFIGLGTAEDLELTTRRNGDRDEYWLTDRRFGIEMHTFVRADQVPRDRMLAESGRRLQRLAAKLIEDMRSGDKLFVYRSDERDLTEAEAAALHRALRRHGEASLLCVRHSDPAHPPGTVEVAAPGLMIGYLEHFAETRPDGSLDVPAEAWAELCRKAYGMTR